MEMVDGNLAALRAYERKIERTEQIMEGIALDYKSTLEELATKAIKLQEELDSLLSSVIIDISDKGLDSTETEAFDLLAEYTTADGVELLECLMEG